MHDGGFLLADEDKERVIHTVACVAAISCGVVAATLGETTAGGNLVFWSPDGRDFFFPPAQSDTLALTFQEWRNRRDKI